jgi:four helix bundle suffix protein
MEMFGKGSGYRWMDAYILAWVVELATDSFCEKFLNFKNDPQGKTSGQMNHAARSGCRNFAEGCERLMTSSASGMDLLNVAKGSLGELRDDYLKWLLRARRLPWDDADPEACAVRRLDLDRPPAGAAAAGTAVPADGPSPAGRQPLGSTGSAGSPRSAPAAPYSNRRFCEHLLAQYAKFEPWLESPDSFVRADALVILCTRAAKMQEAYIRRLGEEFKADGGFKERLGEARREERARQEGGALSGEAPACPECGGAMRLMRRKRDNSPFWGCGGYPGCRGTRPVEAGAAGTAGTAGTAA